VLKTAKEDTNKVNALNKLASELIYNNPDTSIILAEQARAISEKVKSKKHIANSYHNIALANRLKGNYPSSIECNLKALSIREELVRKDSLGGDKSGIAKSLGNIGIVYHEQADYPKALDYYFKALKMDEELGNKNGIARHLGNIGLVYWRQADYSKALDYYFRVLPPFSML
jgi:tetratricopeptide (TPR) repeat protein